MTIDELIAGTSVAELEDDPYPLYARSNVGSFVALLGYPLVVERTLGVGDLVCGELDTISNDTYVPTGDIDRFEFSVAATLRAVLQLDWVEAGDYDLWLESHGAPIDSSHGPAYVPPEAIQRQLSANDDYVVQVDGWAGAPGTWTVTLE